MWRWVYSFQQQAGRLSVSLPRPVAVSCSIMRMYVNDRVQHSQSLCVSVKSDSWVVVMLWRRAGGQREQQQTTKEMSWTKISYAVLTPLNLKWREVPLRISNAFGDVVPPWTRPGPGYKPCVSEHLPYEESAQGTESLPAPGLLLFHSLCALMFLWKGPNKMVKFPHGVSKLTECLESRAERPKLGCNQK